MVRRSLSLCVAAIAAIAVLATSAAAASAAAPTGPATIDASMTKIGTILTNSRGLTLFAFTKDTPNMDNCVTTPFCKFFWPPVLTNGAPVAGPGVDAAMLGTITLPNGMTQVTYNGNPLYGYLFDFFKGQVGYVGITAFGGVWEAVLPDGTLLG
jgi:predicted lipoprotein with Yx(FWY)xxD motif